MKRRPAAVSGEAAQTEVPDVAAFHATPDAALADGALRVVLVLDRAPQELIRLVGFLEAVTHGLVIDLITVASYELDGRRFVVPQRVEPERIVREVNDPGGHPRRSRGAGSWSTGTSRFLNGSPARRHNTGPYSTCSPPGRCGCRTRGSRRSGPGSPRTVTSCSCHACGPDQCGLVSLYVRADGRPALQWWRSVFERRAPGSSEAVSAAGGAEIGRGTLALIVDQTVLDAVFAAYVEASG